MQVCPARLVPSHCSVPSTMLLPHTGPPVVEVDAPPVPPAPPVPVPVDALLLAAGLPLELPLLAVVLLVFAELLPLAGPVLVLAAAPPLPPAPATSPCSPFAHAIVPRAIIQPIQHFRPTEA